jgi:hypothetical protein
MHFVGNRSPTAFSFKQHLRKGTLQCPFFPKLLVTSKE